MLEMTRGDGEDVLYDLGSGEGITPLFQQEDSETGGRGRPES